MDATQSDLRPLLEESLKEVARLLKEIKILEPKISISETHLDKNMADLIKEIRMVEQKTSFTETHLDKKITDLQQNISPSTVYYLCTCVIVLRAFCLIRKVKA